MHHGIGPMVGVCPLDTPYPLPPDIPHPPSGYTLPPLLVTFGGHHWKPVQTCSLEVLFPPHHYWHLVVAIETHTVGKWAVCILLECCLVISTLVFLKLSHPESVWRYVEIISLDPMSVLFFKWLLQGIIWLVVHRPNCQ